MKLPPWTYSLRWRILASYSFILILGGVSTSVIGIRVTGNALFHQAQEQVQRALAAATALYEARLNVLRIGAETLAASADLQAAVREGRPGHVEKALRTVCRRCGFDFLDLADARGRVLVSVAEGEVQGRLKAGRDLVAAALKGETVSGTARVGKDTSAQEASGQEAGRSGSAAGSAWLMQVAASPVRDQTGEVLGVVYGGRLLNASDTRAEQTGARPLVDELSAAVFAGRMFEDRPAGAVTVFADDTCIASSVRTPQGHRALGARAPVEVCRAVLEEGLTQGARTFEAGDWYVNAYAPLTDPAGRRVGMLAVGLLQRPYAAVRNQVTLIFAGIAGVCFLLIVVVTYFLTRGLMRPLEEIVKVSREIADGNLRHRVRVNDRSELGLVSSSFNAMLDRIDEMTTQRYSLLEQYTQQWTETLEQKVRERTEELAKTQAALHRQQRLASLGQLAAGVAHEINNPLGGILTFASLVQEALPEDSPLRGDVEEIVRQADRCRRIVQELLEFSRQRTTRAEPQDINDIVNRTLGMLEKQASFQNVRVIRRLEPNLPKTVVDESQMQQVFMNLMLNAVDAMGEHGTLTLESGYDRERREVFVRVSDTGCGIPPELREAIFNPFFTTKEPGKGTGLGLPVACRIVQAHGGRLDLESEVGRGTTFIVSLPAHEDEKKTAAAPDSGLEASETANTPSNDAR